MCLFSMAGFADWKQMLLQFLGKNWNKTSKIAHLGGDRQFVPACFWSLPYQLSFPASCRLGSRNNTCYRWQNQIPRGLNKDPNGGGVRRCLWTHAGQREPRIKVRLAIMADATTGKLSAGQFSYEMEKFTRVNIEIPVKFGTSEIPSPPSAATTKMVRRNETWLAPATTLQVKPSTIEAWNTTPFQTLYCLTITGLSRCFHHGNFNKPWTLIQDMT